jgi:hypothetical protein
MGYILALCFLTSSALAYMLDHVSGAVMVGLAAVFTLVFALALDLSAGIRLIIAYGKLAEAHDELARANHRTLQSSLEVLAHRVDHLPHAEKDTPENGISRAKNHVAVFGPAQLVEQLDAVRELSTPPKEPMTDTEYALQQRLRAYQDFLSDGPKA